MRNICANIFLGMIKPNDLSYLSSQTRLVSGRKIAHEDRLVASVTYIDNRAVPGKKYYREIAIAKVKRWTCISWVFSGTLRLIHLFMVIFEGFTWKSELEPGQYR